MTFEMLRQTQKLKRFEPKRRRAEQTPRAPTLELPPQKVLTGVLDPPA